MPNASPLNPSQPKPEATPAEADVVEPLWKKVLNERFTILEPIGSGGMGKVYKAIQAPLDRVVAIKVLTPNGGADPGFRQRFFLEASLTSKLRHPNTVTVIDYGETPDGIFYLAMEYLDGQTLAQVLAQSGALHWTRCIRIGQQICRSLREAHKLGIVHRDLKPANVMLLTEDKDQDLVKVLDFGLVKSFLRESSLSQTEITNPGMLLGSPRYMAPEQLRNQADPRTDVYTLGAVLYETLMGQPLFVAKDAIDVMFKHMNETPTPMRTTRPDIEIPKEVEALVMKCLEKQPAWRFQSMEDVLEAMRKAANAAGASGIMTDPAPSDPGVSQVLSRLDSPTVSERAPEGTLAIDIDIDAPLQRRSLRLASTLSNPKLRAALIPISIALVLLIASIAYVSRRHPAEPSEAAAKTQEVAPAAVPAKPAHGVPVEAKAEKPAPVRVAVAKTVTFKIASEPSGARIVLNGRSVGHTPLSVDVPATPEGKAFAELVFTLRGYQPLTVTTGGFGPEVALSQTLQPLSSPRAVPEPRRREMIQAREAPEEKKVSEPEPPVLKKAPVEEPKLVASLELPKTTELPREATPAPPPPAAANAVLSFREGMTPPEQLQGKPIVYSREALDFGVQGTIQAKCVINLRGLLDNCKILKSLPYMDRAVLDALASRRYKPVLLDGKAVAVEYVFDIKLVLKDKERRCLGSRGCDGE